MIRASLITGPFTITAHVSVGKSDDGFGLAVKLDGKFPELAAEKAQALMEAAHQVCPYSRATRGNVEIAITVAS